MAVGLSTRMHESVSITTVANAGGDSFFVSFSSRPFVGDGVETERGVTALLGTRRETRNKWTRIYLAHGLRSAHAVEDTSAKRV